MPGTNGIALTNGVTASAIRVIRRHECVEWTLPFCLYFSAMATNCESFDNAAEYLRRHGVSPTRQRVAIARLLFSRSQHVSAEEVWCLANREDPTTSKATVYNTLNLFSERGLVREVIAHPGKVYYDSNTVPHHHFYNVETGTLTDIESEHMELTRIPEVPPGMVVDGIDIVVRVRPRTRDHSS